MNRLTREELESWRSLGWKYEEMLTPKGREQIGKLCDMALRSLSLESVREEALEEAAKVCDEYAKQAEENFVHEKMYAAAGCAERIRALQSREDVHSTELLK